jgi:hypothetical protein
MNRGNLIRPLLRRVLTATENGVCKPSVACGMRTATRTHRDLASSAINQDFCTAHDLQMKAAET